jgi:spore maturation protein CgeB
MKAALHLLLSDTELAAAMVDAAYSDIVERHTCHHRAVELLQIADSIRTSRHAPVHPLLKEPAS